MTTTDAKDTLEAGTGFMKTLTETMREMAARGYVGNLSFRFDHLELNSGKLKFFPQDFIVDDIRRFENTSDPDDQAILYLISIPKLGLKGLCTESYGFYHEDLSDEMLKRLSVNGQDRH